MSIRISLLLRIYFIRGSDICAYYSEKVSSSYPEWMLAISVIADTKCSISDSWICVWTVNNTAFLVIFSTYMFKSYNRFANYCPVIPLILINSLMGSLITPSWSNTFIESMWLKVYLARKAFLIASLIRFAPF